MSAAGAREVTEAIDAALRSVADPAKAPAMAAYMKHHFAFLGVPKPQREMATMQLVRALTFADESVANLILFDVWHHLEYPGTALAEFQRVLAKGGRLVIFDPAMGLLGRAVYGLCHHEPLALTCGL